MKTGKTGKRILATIVAAGILTLGVAAYAAEASTPADIAARLTGKTYGTIANDAGKLAEFKVASLESKKAILDQQVLDGKITQAQADATYEAIKSAQATCDGTGTAHIGRTMGIGFGSGSGLHNGMGYGRSGNQTGMGMGRGQGMGMHR